MNALNAFRRSFFFFLPALLACNGVEYTNPEALLQGDRLYAADIQEEDLSHLVALNEPSSVIVQLEPVLDDVCATLVFTGAIKIAYWDVNGPVNETACDLEIDETSLYFRTTVPKEELSVNFDLNIEVFGTYTEDWLEVDAFAKVGKVPKWLSVGSIQLSREWLIEANEVIEEEDTDDSGA